MDTIVQKAQELLDSSQPEECIRYILPEAERLPNDVVLLQLLGEAYIENGEPENAYALFLKSAKLDPNGEKGFSKFLWLGQLCGGEEGIEWYERGIEELRKAISDQTDKEAQEILRKRLCEALHGMIEIWMSDLCQEPNAEDNCEKLITEAMMTDDTLAANWTQLGSIRIQQGRDDEAKDALLKSFALVDASQNVGAEDVPVLIRLAQCLLEIAAFGEVLDVTQLISRVDEHVSDAYYLNGLSHYNLFEQEKENGNHRTAARHAVGTKEALSYLLSPPPDMDVSEDICESCREILKTIPEVEDDEWSDTDDEQHDPDLAELET